MNVKCMFDTLKNGNRMIVHIGRQHTKCKPYLKVFKDVFMNNDKYARTTAPPNITPTLTLTPTFTRTVAQISSAHFTLYSITAFSVQRVKGPISRRHEYLNIMFIHRTYSQPFKLARKPPPTNLLKNITTRRIGSQQTTPHTTWVPTRRFRVSCTYHKEPARPCHAICRCEWNLLVCFFAKKRKKKNFC